MREKIGFYENGNYSVILFNDGTKIRFSDQDDFVPQFPESIDVKLTDKCGQCCAFCYEGCTPEGKHAVLDLDSVFFRSLHPYTEMAFNGNDMDHPQMLELLSFLKENKVIANITVNQNQFLKNFNYIRGLRNNGLIHGIGVSLVNADDEFVEKVSELDNVVIHTINGILTKEDIDTLKDRGLKILILGYKELKRGISYKEEFSSDVERNQRELYDVLPELNEYFSVVSFDNLALSQLDVKRIMTDEQWERFFMGEDGHFSFYVDLVNGEFAKNSLSTDRFPIDEKTIDEMFKYVSKIVHTL